MSKLQGTSFTVMLSKIPGKKAVVEVKWDRRVIFTFQVNFCVKLS